MTKRIILQRTPFFLSLEGEGEQSLIKWFQMLSEQVELHIHLDYEVLKGGGYKSMLENAVLHRKRKERQKAKRSILLVDRDRGDRGDDGWTLSTLKQKASEHRFVVCLQNPNLEGLLLRLIPGNERLQPTASNIKNQLRRAWPEYEKPADANTLANKFTLNDLLRVAKEDEDLCSLLQIIGLMK